MIENDISIIGATAVEDILQENIPETIIDLKKAGITIGMATGDKIETAISIGFNCKLLTDDMILLKLLSEDVQVTQSDIHFSA